MVFPYCFGGWLRLRLLSVWSSVHYQNSIWHLMMTLKRRSLDPCLGDMHYAGDTDSLHSGSGARGSSKSFSFPGKSIGSIILRQYHQMFRNIRYLVDIEAIKYWSRANLSKYFQPNCFCFQVRQGRKLDSPSRMLIWKRQPQSRSLEHLCRSQSPRLPLFQRQRPTSTLSLDSSPFPLELRGQ